MSLLNLVQGSTCSLEKLERIHEKNEHELKELLINKLQVLLKDKASSGVNNNFGDVVIAKGSKYKTPGSIHVEGDASSASYFIALGAIAATTEPVRIEGVDLTVLRLPVEEIFFRMLRHREFDIAEMSMGRYVSILSQDNCPFVALPVFPSRMFRHSSIYVNVDGRVRGPRLPRLARWPHADRARCPGPSRHSPCAARARAGKTDSSCRWPHSACPRAPPCRA